MKIIFLVDTYYPLQDGVQIVTQYHAEGLAKKNDVLVVTSLRKGMARSDVHNGVRIERICVKRNPYTLLWMGEKTILRNIILEYQPDVLIVVSHSIWAFDWLRGRLKGYPGKKVLYTHGCAFKEKYQVVELLKKFRIRRQIVADIMKIYAEWFWQKYKSALPQYIAEYDRVIYLHHNDTLYQYIEKFGLGNGKIIENAVEDVFFQRKAYLDDKDKELVFINVSSYVERKNQKLILEAFYAANLLNARLVLIGSQSTSYYKELLQLNDDLIKNYGLQTSKATILCGLSREEVLKQYSVADIYVSASNWEAMSISLCEAAASGMVILSTDVGHAANISGVFLCNNIDDFVRNMRLVNQNYIVRAERGKMAYDYAKGHYVIKDKVNELEQCMINLVRGE